MYGRKPVCIFGTQEFESSASHQAYVAVFDSVLLKRIPFLLEFITNCFLSLSLSFWISVLCRSLSSTIKLESNTIFIFKWYYFLTRKN